MFGGTFSILHWIVVLAVVLLLFGGRGKVSAIMGDFGKGLRNFKTGLKGTEEEPNTEGIEEAQNTSPREESAKKVRPRKKAAAKKTTSKKTSARKATKK